MSLILTGCPDDPVPVESDGATGSSDDGASTSSGGDEESTSTGGSSDDGVDSTGEDSSTGEPPPPPPEIDPIPDPPGLGSSVATTCRVDDDGTMTCWGEGSCGLLADGGELARPPVVTASEWTWASFSGGFRHHCAIAEDRSLWCWGNGLDGKVGDGVLDDGLPGEACRDALMEIDPGTTWARLSLGLDHSCGVQTDGTLWCWGSNEFGQIGDGAVGSLYSRLAPEEVGGTAWIDVYAGYEHTCGLDGAGTTWCWGYGVDGQLGQPGVTFSSVPLEVPDAPPFRELSRGGTGRGTCGVTVDGGVWCWGENQFGAAGVGVEGEVPTPIEVELPAPAAAVHKGLFGACATGETGQLWCWGLGSSGQLGDGVVEEGHFSGVPVPVPGEDWVDVAVGSVHVCGRTGDGQTLCFGDNATGQLGDGTSGPDNGRAAPVPVGPWGGGPVADDWALGRIGGSFGCGRRLDDTLWCWGNRSRGQLGNDDPLDDCSPANPSGCSVTTPGEVSPAGAAAWDEVQLGLWHACAIQTDDTLWCWGENGSNQLGFTGDDATVPTQVGLDADWTAVGLTMGSTCGIRSPGTLWCWGGNPDGVLGLGEIGPQPSPTQVGVETDWTAVSMGDGNHACGLRSDDSLWCWGRNDFGELGIGSISESELPTQVPGTWASVDVGSTHTCAVALDGTLWCWGRGESGELGGGASGEGIESLSPQQVGAATDWVEVEAGVATTCGRRMDQSLWCWGRNTRGQLGQGEVDEPPLLDTPTQVGGDLDWVDVSVSSETVCGQRGGELWCWGTNNDGRQGNDTIFTMGTPREVRNDG